MKYFIEDTTLTNIADAVREKEESTQPIPVVELAERIRDIQTGSTVGKQLNDDGTQNVFVDDTKGDTIDTGRPIASVKYNGVDVALVGGSGEIDITADGTYDVSKYATANVDVVSLGTKTITANGTHDVAKYASAMVNVMSAPELIWENASPSDVGESNFTYYFSGDWDAYFVENEASIYFSDSERHIDFITGANGNSGGPNKELIAYRDGDITDQRAVYEMTRNSLTFRSYHGLSASCVPTRIWGVKFTL